MGQKHPGYLRSVLTLNAMYCIENESEKSHLKNSNIAAGGGSVLLQIGTNRSGENIGSNQIVIIYTIK
jgi:hypothetical protein